MADDMIDCVVVGGGPAGLTAAYRLSQAGLTVQVIEKEGRVGGRMKGGTWKGRLWYDQGAQFLCEDGSPIVRLANELGIRTIPFVFEEGPAAVYHKGKLSVAENLTDFSQYAKMRDWPASVVAEFEDTQARLAHLAADLDAVDRDVSRQAHDVLDRMSFADVLGEPGREVQNEFEYVIRDVISHDPAVVSGVQGVLVAARFDTMKFLYAEGGAHGIWTEMSERLGDRIALDSEVLKAWNRDDHVEIEYVGNGTRRTLLAKYGIIAATTDQVLGIVDELPDRKRAALEKITYGPFVTCIFLTNEGTVQDWDRFTTVRVPDMETMGAVVHQSFLVRKAESERSSGSVLMTLASERTAARLIELPDEEIREETAAELLNMFPALEGKIEKILVKKWSRGVPAMPVGGHAIVPQLRAPVGRLYFCGDYMADGVPEANPAITSAEQAAAAIAMEVNARR